MRGEAPDEARDGAGAWIAGPVEQPLGGAEHRTDVAAPPRVGERESRRLRARCDKRLHLALADPVAAGPGRELVDLRRELVQIVADELEQETARLGVRGGATE